MSAPVYYDNPSDGVPVTPVVFTDMTTGRPADPSSVTGTLIDPTGAQTAFTYTDSSSGPNEIVRTTTGNYGLTLTGLTANGLFTFIWQGTGNNVQQVTPTTFRILPLSAAGSGMTRWYTGMEELKSRLSITDNRSDYEIQRALMVTKNFIDTYTMQHFDQLTETRTFQPHNLWELEIDPLCSDPSLLSNLEVKLDYDGDGVYEVDWTLNENYMLKYGRNDYNADTYGVRRPYKRLQILLSEPGVPVPEGGGFLPFIWPFTHFDRVQITGTWGWDEIPPGIQEASMIMATDLFKMKDSVFGNMGISDLGITKATANPMIIELMRPFLNTSKKVGV